MDLGHLDSSDGESSIDDEFDAGLEATRTFLYRHFTIYVIRNPEFSGCGSKNLMFIKAHLLHIKGEDKNQRV